MTGRQRPNRGASKSPLHCAFLFLAARASFHQVQSRRKAQGGIPAQANLSEETRGRAAEGVVAYSAVCTHQACPVNMWSKERDAFVCSCHGSVYGGDHDDGDVRPQSLGLGQEFKTAHSRHVDVGED